MSELPALDFIKKKKEAVTDEEAEKIDMEKVDKIVSTMKKKYTDEGVSVTGADEGKLGELRGLIVGTGGAKFEVQKIEDLKESDSKVVKRLGNLFLSMRGLTNPLFALISKMPATKQLDFNLYSANMRYSARQWVALTTITALIVFLVVAISLGILTPLVGMPLWLPAILAVVGFLFTVVLMFLIPRQKAQTRGKSISRELPFALRHIATQLSAGIGLYRTIQTVASADYGTLSEEFSRTISEIEEGTDTRDALRHLALRTQSNALRNALMHTIRALKTGGNLSEIMNEIATDVAFQLRMRVKEFSEKMNFIGVIFIFIAIVIPVFIAILGGISVTPIFSGESAFLAKTGATFAGVATIDPTVMALVFLVIMPTMLAWIFFFIFMMQPHV